MVKETPLIILIDDDPIVLTFCKMIIKRTYGIADVKAFTVPEVGLEYLKSEFTHSENEIPALLFLDINMPTMSGWEFLEYYEILDDTIKKHIHIYIHSSSVDDRDLELARLNKNVVDYLIKPFTKENLNKLLPILSDTQV